MRLPDFSDESSCIEVEPKLEERLLYLILSDSCMLALDFWDLRLDLLGLMKMPCWIILCQFKLNIVANFLDISHVDSCESA